MSLPLLAIDFDGVIMQRQPRTKARRGPISGRYELKGSTMPGTHEALKALASEWSLVLHTCRAQDERGAMLVRRYLARRKLLDYFTEITAIKPDAVAYIDDKAFRFTNWDSVTAAFTGGDQ